MLRSGTVAALTQFFHVWKDYVQDVQTMRVRLLTPHYLRMILLWIDCVRHCVVLLVTVIQ